MVVFKGSGPRLEVRDNDDGFEQPFMLGETTIAGVKVKKGDSKTFVFKKDSGYAIESVTGKVDSIARYSDGRVRIWVDQGPRSYLLPGEHFITPHFADDIASVVNPAQ